MYYNLKESEWNKVLKQYKKLMYMICHRIGGDRVANDFDDSFQELSTACMEAITTFHKKTGKEFDEFFGTTEFDKYIKTCLWNKKNNLGLKIKKKYGIRNCISLSGTPDSLENFSELAQTPLDLSASDDVQLEAECKTIVEMVLADRKLIKPDGKINISKLSNELGKTKTQVRFIIEKLQHHLRDYAE